MLVLICPKFSSGVVLLWTCWKVTGTSVQNAQQLPISSYYTYHKYDRIWNTALMSGVGEGVVPWVSTMDQYVLWSYRVQVSSGFFLFYMKYTREGKLNLFTFWSRFFQTHDGLVPDVQSTTYLFITFNVYILHRRAFTISFSNKHFGRNN